MSVSGPGLRSLPAPGIYRDGVDHYEIRHSKRGHWYAMRQEPDGSTTYLAQEIDLSILTVERQRGDACAMPDCSLPQWHQNLCGMHLSADAVRRSRAINIPRFPRSPSGRGAA